MVRAPAFHSSSDLNNTIWTTAFRLCSAYTVAETNAESSMAGLANSPPPEPEEDINNSIVTNPDPSSSETQGRGDDSMNLDGAGDSNQLPASLQADGANGTEEVEARIPQKKDATLKEFLGKMDDYAPIIPDAVTNHYLTLAGLPPPPQTPPHLARLLALATQKFVADIAADAYQYARIRSSHTTSNTANAMMGANLGLPGQAPGAGGIPGVAGGAGGADAKGGAGAKGNPALGSQRPGFGGGGQGAQAGRTVLTMEDLGMAVGEYGVNVKRGEWYR